MNMNIARKYAQEVCLTIMEHSGFKASVMAADKLPDNGTIHPLPPGTAIPAIPIHCLPGCPENWLRESGSYVIPVSPDMGLWFNWRMNDEYSTAIVPSVKGMNPITGQKMEGCQMEQYRDVCPVHNISFAHGRYCEECQYSWAPQNYIWGSPSWIDGFFQSDGTTRQFFYTEEEQRDVASALIGKKNTMPAFGFAFFKYKHERPVNRVTNRGFKIHESIGNTIINHTKDWSYDDSSYTICSTLSKGPSASSASASSTSDSSISNSSGKYGYNHEMTKCCSLKSGKTKRSAGGGASASNDSDGIEIMSFCEELSEDSSREVLTAYCLDPSEAQELHSKMYSADSINMISEEEGRKIRPEMYEKKETKEVSIGAGAVIRQELSVDTRPLSEYHSEPQALIRIYFCFEEQFKSIVDKGGVKKLEQKKNGFLAGVPVIG